MSIFNINTGIYLIKNNINGKVYVGSSVNIKKRFAEHKRILKLNEHHSNKLQNAWNKYGELAFSFYIIQHSLKEDLLIVEQYWIDFFDSSNLGYNCSKSAGSPMSNRKHTKESKVKMSLAKKDRILSESHKLNIRKACEGINKGLQARLGKKNSQHQKDAIRKSRIITLINSKGEIFESVTIAADAYNIPRSTLEAMLRGQNPNKTDLKYKKGEDFGNI